MRQDPNRSWKDVDILSLGRQKPTPQAGALQRTQENQNLWSHASKQLHPVCQGLKFPQPGSWPLRKKSALSGSFDEAGYLKSWAFSLPFCTLGLTLAFYMPGAHYCLTISQLQNFSSSYTSVKGDFGSYPGLLLFRLDSVTSQYPFKRDAIDKILFLSPLLCWPSNSQYGLSLLSTNDRGHTGTQRQWLPRVLVSIIVHAL